MDWLFDEFRFDEERRQMHSPAKEQARLKMVAELQVAGNTKQASVRMGSTNNLAYVVLGTLLVGAFVVPSLETLSQAPALLMTFVPTTILLISCILRLESRITALESQVGSHLTRDSIQD